MKCGRRTRIINSYNCFLIGSGPGVKMKFQEMSQIITSESQHITNKLENFFPPIFLSDDYIKFSKKLYFGRHN